MRNAVHTLNGHTTQPIAKRRCERKDGEELQPIADATAAEYLLTKEHIGVVVAVKCTPVRQVDDESGETVVQETQTVTAALPLLSSVAIVGDLVEGQVTAPSCLGLGLGFGA